MIYIQILIVLLCFFIGIRLKGISIGAMSVVGVLLLVYFFHNPVSSPPVDVIFIVLAVVAASATMQVAGGIEFLVKLSERILRKFPHSITFVAPVVTYFFTLFAGTGCITYAILPVIVEVAMSAQIRPERPLSSAVVASQMAITASPTSAASAVMLGLLVQHKTGFDLLDVMQICIPATFIGSLAGALTVCRRGADINYQWLANSEAAHRQIPELATVESEYRKGVISVVIFMLGVLTIIALGLNDNLRPVLMYGEIEKRLEMTTSIQLIMMAVIISMVVICRCDPVQIPKTPVMQAGLISIFSIMGVAWLGNCFFNANRQQITTMLSDLVTVYPWVFSFALFALSTILYSQSATVVALMGLGFALEIPAQKLIAMFPAVNGFFLFPTSGLIVAAVAFDRTGSTQAGRYIINHSFMRPGLVATLTAVSFAFVFSN